MADVVLETRGLTKQFRDIRAVDSVDLSVHAGEVFGFLGPNGAGKTTTIGMILGLLHPTAGQVRIFGEQVTPDHAAALATVGALVGTPAMIPSFTARQNLQLMAYVTPTRIDETDRIRRVEEVLAQVGLSEAADRKVGGFSLGMKQRLGLGASLLHHPQLLILDEPTNGLDPAGMRDIRDLLRDMAADGVTVFISSHLLHEIEQVCDRVAVLNHGRVVAHGAVRDLLAGDSRAAIRVRARVPEPQRAAAALETLDGISRIQPNGHYVEVAGVASEAVCLHLVQHGIVPSELIILDNDLEDIFLQLTQETA